MQKLSTELLCCKPTVKTQKRLFEIIPRFQLEGKTQKWVYLTIFERQYEIRENVKNTALTDWMLPPDTSSVIAKKDEMILQNYEKKNCEGGSPSSDTVQGTPGIIQVKGVLPAELMKRKQQ
ncbi:hypothetical protein NPIL_461081 [Nephila pilipes]|uniref:Uncharacterized protein n=1 Tax=Nephila pilipes TaxID=299642 RepID=A0A8X6UBX2_NEPPI|nr:hypothetical protein NPIL_461081 [Nephila pilipes]